MNSQLWVRAFGIGLNIFSATEPFSVDGIRYNPDHRSNVARLIVQDSSDSHDCRPDLCAFDHGSDTNSSGGMCRTKSYRWRPGLVYYRASEFDTPIYGS